MNDVTAQLNNLRMTPRKVRALAALIRKKDVSVAVDQLSHATRRASAPLLKLIASAVANAEHKTTIDRTTLYIKDIAVNEGTKLKRFMPKGFGRANPIEKKTSRIKIVLGQREPAVKAAPIKAKA